MDDERAEGEAEREARARVVHFEEEGLAPRWFALLFLASAIGLGVTLLPFASDAILALVLVATFQQLHRSLTTRLGGRPWIASAVVTALVVVLVAGPVAGLVATVIDEAQQALQRSDLGFAAPPESASTEPDAALDGAPEPSPTVRWVQRFLRAAHVPEIRADILEQLAAAGAAVKGALLGQLTRFVNDALSAVFHFAVVLVLVFYLLVDAPRLKAFLFELSPLPDEEEEMLVGTFKSVSRGILLGNGIGSAIQGILGGIAIAAVGAPSPVLWGTVMAILAFLPLVGISVVVVPMTIYLWLVGKHGAAIGFFAFCTAQGLFVENVVKTRLIGKQTRMHDLLVFLCILGGLGTFGILGILYGPLLATAFLSLGELYRRKYRPAFAERYARRELAGKE